MNKKGHALQLCMLICFGAWVPLRSQPLHPYPEPDADLLLNTSRDFLDREGATQDVDASDEPDATPPKGAAWTVHETSLVCGESAGPLEGARRSGRVIPFEVGEDLTRLTLRMHGGAGDADLYVRYAEVPELHNYDHRPYVNGNAEEVVLETPGAGQWYLLVHGYRDYRDVTIDMECVKALAMEPGVEVNTTPDIELTLYYELSGAEQGNRENNTELQYQLLNQRGREAYNAGRFDEAMELWTRWMNRDEDNPRPVALVGDLHLRAENLDEAIKFYRKSLEMQPGQVALMTRLAQLLDIQAEKPMEARQLLNRYSRLFPHNTAVALGQAGWLIRRNRYDEAMEIIRKVIEEDPENLDAMTLLHPLLRGQRERYDNMMNMVKIGRMPGREVRLGFAIKDNDLLTQPESWLLMDFVKRMSVEAPTVAQRKLFRDLLPRDEVTVEDFRIGRMSTNWVSSREEAWGEEGNLILSADPSQTEAFLRLVRSDAMSSGFIDVEVDDTRGTFWIYARRGQGNMVRFGFEENGQLYLQVWMNNHLVTNETRVWSRPPGTAKLRLEVLGDGAMGYINGQPAFGSPVTLPADMGLGWWGIAPWSAQYGTAQVSVRRIAGGPLPIRLALVPDEALRRSGFTSSERNGEPGERGPLVRKLNQYAEAFSTLAPEWYHLAGDGGVRRLNYQTDLELRLLARYYRMRLLPMVRVESYDTLDVDQLAEVALRDGMDGFTLLVDRMPSPEWVSRAREAALRSGITLHVVLLDPNTGEASFRELCPNVGIFPGPRRQFRVSHTTSSLDNDTEFSPNDPDAIMTLAPGSER